MTINTSTVHFLIKKSDFKDLFNIMKVCLFLLFAFTFQMMATNTNAQSAVIEFKSNKTSVREFINEIEKQTDYLVVYSNREVDTSREVNLKNRTDRVSEYLTQVFGNTDISYDFENNYIVLSKRVAENKVTETVSAARAQQQGKTITGTVVDVNGDPVIGATIVVQGDATKGTVTDYNGNFSLNNISDSDILEVSYVGMKVSRIETMGRTVLQITMLEDTELLQEVVVTALGIKREEKALGYAVQKVSGENFSTVKPVDIATSLSGRVAGLNIKNSTEFNASPTISLRGAVPLLVVDGVPYGNVSLNDIAADDIESIDILKGATASALYGARGGAGAVMVTTKRGQEEGLSVTVNSSTMFNAGYLKKPQVQTSYSSGSGGKYYPGDYVWGDKLDIGREANQYNPFTHEWEVQPLVSKGKNNLKNFQEVGLITNNNISVSQKGKYGSVRSSLSHVYNKGQYPNQKLNKFTYSVSGDMKWNNFSFDGGITFNKRFFPNDIGAGYGGSGFLYNLLIWTGTEYDIRDYKDYWVREGEVQNWMDKVWYDNPYFTANEITRSSDYNITNGYLSSSYDFNKWLTFSLRSGIDVYSEKKQWRNPIGASGGWDRNGYYSLQRLGGYSLNNDAILTADYSFNDFEINGLVGGTIYHWKDDWIMGETQNGITVPGFYSLKASVDGNKVTSGITKKQVNSLYSKISLSWKGSIFLDITGRNDWSSTLPSETRSYFYPSVASSIVLSQLFTMPKEIDLWKIRGSWTQTKSDLGVYATNNTYSISNNLWNGTSAAYYPSSIRGVSVLPSASESFEIGTAVALLKNRIRADITYYQNLHYNLTRSAPISSASGFSSTLINIEEEQIRKGMEITLSGDIIRTNDWNWSSTLNWARDRYYYNNIDPIYSTQAPWVKAGNRWDWYGIYDYERDTAGNIIHEAGYPVISKYQSVAGYEYPDWIWGLLNSVSYKNLTMSITFDGRVGGVTHSRTDQALWNSGAHIDSDNIWRYKEVVDGEINYIGNGVKVVSGSVDYDANGNITRDDRVFEKNDVSVSYETYMIRMNPYIGSIRSQNVLDQTFFKLRDVSLTYRLSKTASTKLNLNGASLSVIGQNLLIWTKEFRFSDPDRASDNINSPSSRFIGFNIKLDF